MAKPAMSQIPRSPDTPDDASAPPAGPAHELQHILAESKGRVFESLLDLIPSVAIMLSPDFSILEFNTEAERLYGRSRQEVLGRNYLEQFLPDNISGVVAADGQRVLAGQPTRGFENTVRTSDGEERVLSWYVDRVVDAGGKPVGLIAIGQDITEHKRAERLSEALTRINAAISSTLDFDRIMQRVVVESAQAIRTESAVIYIKEDDEWVLSYLHQLPSEFLGLRYPTVEAPLLNLTAQGKAPVVSNDALNDDRLNREMMEEYETKSLMAVPLVAKERVAGVLLFEYHSRAVAFTEAEVDFAQKLATSVSLALENARLFQAQHKIAKTLQEALLAVPPRVEGIDFAYLYHSATEAALVGGDFLDVFDLEEGNIGLLIGDVSGKGVEAAALASLVKNTVRAYAYQESSPAAILQRTDEAVQRSSDPSHFVSVFFAILDARTGSLTFCNAGHPPALVKRRSGSGIEPLSPDSPVLGISSGLPFRTHRTALEPGDLMLLSTDGVTEARREGSLFGQERLQQSLDRLNMPAAQVPKHLFDEITVFSAGRLSDDVALMALSLASSP